MSEITPKIVKEALSSTETGFLSEGGIVYYAQDIAHEYLKLHEENQRLQQDIFLLKSWQEKFTDSRYDPECVAEELRDKVDRLQVIVDKQREALEFYGDTNNYKEGNTIRPYERHFPVLEDAGVIAIKALALTATDKENG